MKTKMILLLTIFLSVALLAQKNDYTNYKGYVDLGSFDSFDESEEFTEVLIEEHLIRMVAKMAKNREPELSEILDGIKLVRVHAFETNDNSFIELKSRAEKIDNELMSKDWDRIVKVRGKSEFVNVYIKTESEDLISGLVVASVEKNGEAAFVNIVGKIDLETIGRLSDQFDIPSLGHIGKESNGHDKTKNK
jgi:hypothetical protein